MTTITIEQDTENQKIPSRFATHKDLLAYLIDQYSVNPVLVQVDYEDLPKDEQKAYQKHKKQGYDHFVDFRG